MPCAIEAASVHDGSIVCLGDDLLLQICSLLSAEDLITLRQTCRYFSTISRSRYLWNRLLQCDVTRQHRPVPSYRRPDTELNTTELELLTRRALSLDEPCRQPVITRLTKRESVTWVRLVRAQWLLVSWTSPQELSSLVLYSLKKTEHGKLLELAMIRLPGVVSSGEVEVQKDGLVIALCFQIPQCMTSIFTVTARSGNGKLDFTQLACIDGLSHIRCVRGDLLGCGAYLGGLSPCVANWKTGQVVLLPTSRDAPAQCLAFALRENLAVVISSLSLTIYSLSPSTHVELLQVITFDRPVGSVSISAEDETLPQGSENDNEHVPLSVDAEPGNSQSSPSPVQTRMFLFTAASTSVAVLRLRQHDMTAFSIDVLAESQLKHGDVLSSRPSLPHFGGSIGRVAWIYAPTCFLDRNSSLVTGRFVSSSSSPTPSSSSRLSPPARPSAAAATPAPASAKFVIMSECKDAQLPGFHAMPLMDYDDGAGLVVLGNACGELAVCNYAGPITDALVQCLKPIPVPTCFSELAIGQT